MFEGQTPAETPRAASPEPESALPSPATSPEMEKVTNIPLSGAAILTLLSGFSYLQAYEYELGFSRVFGFPPELIELRWSNLFAAGIATIVLVSFGVSAARMSTSIGDSKSFASTASKVIPIGFVLIVMVALLGAPREMLLPAGIGTLLAYSLFALYVHRTARRYPKPTHRRRPPLAEERMAFFGFSIPAWLVVAATCLLLSVFYANAYGRATALNMVDFWVTTDSKPQAIVRAYADKLVTAELDLTTQTLRPIYHILPVVDPTRTFLLEHYENSLPVCEGTPPVPRPGLRTHPEESLRRCRLVRNSPIHP